MLVEVLPFSEQTKLLIRRGHFVRCIVRGAPDQSEATPFTSRLMAVLGQEMDQVDCSSEAA